VYPAVLKSVVLETGLSASTFPSECPFPPDQILDREFLPE